MVSVGGKEKGRTMRNNFFIFRVNISPPGMANISLSLSLSNDQRCIGDVSSQFVVFAEENSERDGERREFLLGASQISRASVQRCSGYLNA